ncbi:MAG: enoyl-ACP reductase FabI [Oscillatoriales cyanobacterium SM2_2_1]|nr:enoyl-ACP reductase FabI [Oscillatoriales cyanobacterium SM2_2_1]
MLDLSGKNALVTGIANERSIAWGIARKLHQAGAKLGVTFLPDDRDRNKGKVAALVEPLAPDFLLPCNVQEDTQVDSLIEGIREHWAKIDILIHCLAFANKEDLSGNFVEVSRSGFQLALDVSAYSLIHLCRAVKPLMTDGGSVITLTYIGGARVVPNYNVMGIAKAALEMNVRYLAADLGPGNIRVNGISAGPIRTLASAAIGDFHSMLHHYEEKAPLKRLVSQEEVGNVAAFLASDLASPITGQILYADCGFEVMAA